MHVDCFAHGRPLRAPQPSSSPSSASLAARLVASAEVVFGSRDHRVAQVHALDGLLDPNTSEEAGEGAMGGSSGDIVARAQESLRERHAREEVGCAQVPTTHHPPPVTPGPTPFMLLLIVMFMQRMSMHHPWCSCSRCWGLVWLA